MVIMYEDFQGLFEDALFNAV